MPSVQPTDALLGEIFARTRRIAMVGASPRPDRPSHDVMHYLLNAGYAVVPVNPQAEGEVILGQRVVARLADAGRPVDLVNIFRNRAAAGAAVDEAIALQDALALTTVWMQIGVCDEAAADRARRVGLTVVMDRCIKIDDRRLRSWAAAASLPLP
jgi:predicted CoA-binding protein